MKKMIKMNVENAYRKGNRQDKRLLKNLCPDFDFEKVNYDHRNIYAHKEGEFVYKLHEIRSQQFVWICLYQTSTVEDSQRYKTGQGAIDNIKGVREFSGQSDFFEWARIK